MDHELTLVPAYGRDYLSEEDVRADWLGGKDFRIECVVSPHDGRYCSVRDVAHFTGEQCKIRFDKLSRYIIVDIKTGAIHGEAEDCVEAG